MILVRHVTDTRVLETYKMPPNDEFKTLKCMLDFRQLMHMHTLHRVKHTIMTVYSDIQSNTLQDKINTKVSTQPNRLPHFAIGTQFAPLCLIIFTIKTPF